MLDGERSGSLLSPAMDRLLSAGLLGVTLLLLFVVAALRFRRRRLPGEPPLDKGFIPWVGHALEFGKDAAKLFREMRQKHGDIFTIQAVGKFVTILLDPHSYDAVLWESRSKLDFGQYARLLMDRMFDVRLPDFDQNVEKAMLRMCSVSSKRLPHHLRNPLWCAEELRAFVDVWHGEAVRVTRAKDYRNVERFHYVLKKVRALQNENLHSLTKSMFFNLHTVMLSDPRRASQQWNEEGLFQLSYSIMLRAGYLTLYGNADKNYEDPCSQAKDRAHSLEVYNEFYKLDRLLMKAARSMLSAAQKKEFNSIKKNLWKLLSIKRLNNRANRSVWLDIYKQHLVDMGVDEDMQTRAMLLQLWSTQSNAGPAVFWLLLFLLKHPPAMVAVQHEIGSIFKKNKRQTVGQVQGLSQKILDSTPIFDSALNEALRLTAAPFISREVLQDMSLRLADGREYNLRKGDRLCLFPFISPQMDPDVYEEPETFKYDRFICSDGTEKNDFYKRGEKLKYYTMPWGAGLNVCIGKFHAINSIKQCVFLLLSNFDLELKDPTVKIPDFDKERYGFGMLQPENDIIVRYKLKDQ